MPVTAATYRSFDGVPGKRIEFLKNAPRITVELKVKNGTR